MMNKAILIKKRCLLPILGLSVLFFPFIVFHVHVHKLDKGYVENQKVKLEARTKGGGRQAIEKPRTDDDQQYTELFKDTEENDVSGIYNHPHMDFGTPQCGCVVGDFFGNAGIARPANVTIVQIRKPKRRFHSNHWFHIGEYFISQSQNPDVTGVVNSGDTIMLVANEVMFLNKLTFAAAFFILLAFSSGNGCADGSILSTRLEFYEPSHVYRRSNTPSAEWGSFSSYGPSVVLDMSKPSGQQFQRINLLENVRENLVTGQRCRCGKLISSIGFSPTPSTLWFGSALDTREFREKLKYFCQAEVPSTYKNSIVLPLSRKRKSKDGESSFKLTVFERNTNRHFDNLELIISELDQQLSPKWTISTIKHSEDMEPCQLYHELHKTDVFLTTHGFQSTALMFLRAGSAIVEIYPYKYWKPSYIPLATVFGVHHYWAQNTEPTSVSRWYLKFISQEWCMRMNRCRSHARGDSVAMPSDHLDLVIRIAKRKEEGKFWGDSGFSNS